jgi:hypothetical protein
MKLEKKVKKQSQLVNLLNLQPMSWDGDNLIKRKYNVEGPMTRTMKPR